MIIIFYLIHLIYSIKLYCLFLKQYNIMTVFFCVCLVGAGDSLVHWVPGANLFLLPGLSGGERIQQGVCHLR